MMSDAKYTVHFLLFDKLSQISAAFANFWHRKLLKNFTQMFIKLPNKLRNVTALPFEVKKASFNNRSSLTFCSCNEHVFRA